MTVRLGGTLQSGAPAPSAAPRGPRLIVRLNGVVQSVVPLPSHREADVPNSEAYLSAALDTQGHESEVAHQVESPPNEVDIEEDIEESDGEESDGEEDGLATRVKNYYDKEAEEKDAEDGPDWMFDDGETTSKDPQYVFCPAPHRKQILRLFTKHFCQHPLFTEKDGNLTGQEIRTNAVHEMYNFCRVRGLCEVWGYMWACWYSPKMWKLWARSKSPYISRLRTTMNVENFWRQLKHDHLHHVSRPRLDHLVWIMIHKITPAYVARTEVLNDEYRAGRSKSLTTYQKYFKKSWKKLLGALISKNQYKTDVNSWTCNCGRQKYDRHHICKHLVQTIGLPSISFWSEVYRCRTTPLYRHHELDESRESTGTKRKHGAYIDIDGSISDGDDHVWLGNPTILAGGGGWKSVLSTENMATALGKQRDDQHRDKNHKTAHHELDSLTELDPAVLSHEEEEVMDLLAVTAPSSPSATSNMALQRSSSPVMYGSDDEAEVRIFSVSLLYSLC